MIINHLSHITVLPTATKKDVNFYDYDGTLIVGYTIAEAQALSALPTAPTHDLLTFQEWNYTLAQVNATTSALDVGATYITSDGKSYFYITLTAVSGLSPTFYFNKSDTSTLTIDYGDGNTATSAASGNINFAHTYVAVGNYVVKTWISNGTGAYGFGNGSDLTVVINGATAVYRQTLTKVSIGINVTAITDYAFGSCKSISLVSIPSSITSIGQSAFTGCSSLLSATIPIGITVLGANAFNSCVNLAFISIPIGITTLGTSAFISDSLPNRIVIPDSVTSLGNGVFQNCYGCKIYTFKATTPPALTSATTLSGILSTCKIRVPAASLSAYQAATYWSTYANYMEGY